MSANLTCDGTPFGICAIRVAKLDNNGVPLPGSGNVYVKHDPIEAKLTKQKKTNIRYDQNDGCGNLRVSIQLPDQIQGMNIALTLCQLDAELLGFMTGGEIILDGGGNTIGFYEPPVGQISGNGVSVEMWSQKWEGAHIDPDFPYYRWGCGKVLWTTGDYDMKEGIMIIPVDGVAYENPNFFHGPFHDWPVPMDRINGWFLDTKLPDETCLPIPLPAS